MDCLRDLASKRPVQIGPKRKEQPACICRPAIYLGSTECEEKTVQLLVVSFDGIWNVSAVGPQAILALVHMLEASHLLESYHCYLTAEHSCSHTDKL